MIGSVKQIAQSNCILGEGPLWLAQTNELVFVDIIGKRLLSWNEKTGLSEVALVQRVGSLVATEAGGFLAASERGLFMLDGETGALTSLGQDQIIGEGNLMNDGKCDRQGRFVFGSKSLNESDKSGTLMRFCGGEIKSSQAGIVMNGPAFSPDGTRIYFADSPSRNIYFSAYCADTGDMGTPEIFVTLAEDAGYPDGMTVDAEGCLWNAHWDGWRISRYGPDGALLAEIQMPVAKPTSLAFGGPDMTTLFVTSAQAGRAQDMGKVAPMEGDLFAIETDISGLVETKYRGAYDA